MIVLKEGRNYIELRLESFNLEDFNTKIGTIKNIVYLSKMLEVYEEETYKDWAFYFNIFREIYYNKEVLEYEFLTKDPEEISLYTTFLNEKFLKNKTIQEALKDVKRGYFYATQSNGYRDIIIELYGDTALNKLELIFKERRELEDKLKKTQLQYKKLKEKVDALEKTKGKKHTKVAIHTMSQFFGDNKQLSFFSEDKIDVFKDATGLNLTNRPDNYGVVLNQAQKKVFEGILKAFTDTNYLGDEQKDKKTAFTEIYSDTPSSALTLVKGDNAPYKNIEAIPVIKLTQAEIIELSGYDLKSQRQGDKQDVIEALTFLAINQFCFYWVRLKTDNGKPVKDKSGDYVKEEVMEVGTLLRIKTVRDQTGLLQYYEIQPSAPILDQVSNYFLLVPNNWRDEVKQLTGKRASSYTYELLLWLRLQYEQIRRYNNNNKKRRAKDFKLTKSWEDVAIALKMPESMYKANRKRASKIIEDAYSTAISLGYLLKVENNGATDILYLNEKYYPKPGELI